jgi:hypothetical protein
MFTFEQEMLLSYQVGTAAKNNPLYGDLRKRAEDGEITFIFCTTHADVFGYRIGRKPEIWYVGGPFSEPFSGPRLTFRGKRFQVLKNTHELHNLFYRDRNGLWSGKI